MQEISKIHVGLAVHKDSISVAVAEPGRVPARLVGKVIHDVGKLLKALVKLGRPNNCIWCTRLGRRALVYKGLWQSVATAAKSLLHPRSRVGPEIVSRLTGVTALSCGPEPGRPAGQHQLKGSTPIDRSGGASPSRLLKYSQVSRGENFRRCRTSYKRFLRNRQGVRPPCCGRIPDPEPVFQQPARSLGGRRNCNFQENFRPLRTAQVALFRRRQGVRLPEKRLTFADFSSVAQTPSISFQ